MLDLEASLHAERGAFLDCERVFVEALQRTRFRQVDDDILASFDFQAQREDDDFTLVVGIR